jgi:transposase
MKDFLAAAEIVELKNDHRGQRESRFADRIKSILMLNSGLSPSKVAEYLLLDKKTVRNYRERYLADGLEGLCEDWHLGRKSSLSLADLDVLERELLTNIHPTTTAVIYPSWLRFPLFEK